jgi:hypothetical protein
LTVTAGFDASGSAAAVALAPGEPASGAPPQPAVIMATKATSPLVL